MTDADRGKEKAGRSNGGADKSRQPLFYRRPEPLDPVRHKGLGISAKADYGFASTANAVMLTAMEFALASRTYPIVFTTGQEPSPVAILGVRKDQNLFVSDGRWAPRTYIPAYIRRYPFAFVESDDKTRLTLCIDVEAEAVTADAETKFFDDSEPSEYTKKALDFCTSFQTQHNLTNKLCAELRKHELLISRQAEITLPNGEKTAIRDFLIVDEQKLNSLPDEVFLEFRKSGLLPFVYFHLMSIANFRDLSEKATS